MKFHTEYTLYLQHKGGLHFNAWHCSQTRNSSTFYLAKREQVKLFWLYLSLFYFIKSSLEKGVELKTDEVSI